MGFFHTGLLAKLVVSSKDIEENSEFDQSFPVIWDIQNCFYLKKKISTVE